MSIAIGAKLPTRGIVMFNAIVTQKILPEKRAEFEALVKELEANTICNDDGCLRYEWYRSEEPNTYYVIESWTSEAAVQAHLKAPHFSALMPKLRECVPGPFSFVRIAKVA
jgi:quinol monooxygenase YgiN